MTVDPRDSRFLRELKKWIEQGPAKIGTIEFYQATLDRDAGKSGTESWPKSGDNIDPAAAAAGKDSGYYNASIGGLQIGMYLQSLLYKNSEIDKVKGFFNDPIFIAYLLQTYSQVKVFSNGNTEVQTVNIPEEYRVSKVAGKQFNALLESAGLAQNIFYSAINNSTFKYGVFFNKSDYEKYDDFFRGRLPPVIFGGLPKSIEDNGFTYLNYIFRDHLEKKGSPDTWTSGERKLFLLMSGKRYAENDVAYLNIMDAGPGKKKYVNVLPLKDFWDKHYSKTNELERDTGNIGSSLGDLLGESFTLQTFAKYISHGSPGSPEGYVAIPQYSERYSNSGSRTGLAPFMVKFSPDQLTLAFPPLTYKDTPRVDDGVQAGPFDAFIEKGGPPEALFTGYYPNLKVNSAFRFLKNPAIIPLERFEQLKDSGIEFLPQSIKTYKSPITRPPKSEDSITLTAILEADIANRVKINNAPGPTVSKLLDIPKENTILDYDPDKHGDKLAQQIVSAASREISQGTGGGSVVVSGQLPATLTFAPLKFAIKVVNEEWDKLNKRVDKFNEIDKNTTEEERDEALKTSGLTLQPWSPDPNSSQSQDNFLIQLWKDAVNIASAKVAQWLLIQESTKEVVIRWTVVKNLVRERKTNDQIADILKQAKLDANTPSDQADVYKGAGIPAAPAAPPPPLDPDEARRRMEERRKNIDQCLLSTNIEPLKIAYHNLIKDEMKKFVTDEEFFTIHRTAAKSVSLSPEPFGGRFHLLQHSEGKHTSIPNLLTASPGNDLRPFLDITPDLMSALIPKIRLFRVTADVDGSDIETEFIFKNFVSPNEVKSLSNANQIQKGQGGGIKSFSFSYEGGTPATAKKDINAELVLFFQSFNELTKQRVSSGTSYRYIDLLLYPNTANNKPNKKIPTDGAIHANQYNPTNFRIRADVGWYPRSDKEFKDLLQSRNIKLEDFNKAIGKINKTFLLNMIDHDIDFRNDGSVEIKISYAAYIESQLRSTLMNALSTPQIEAFKLRERKQIQKLLENNECTAGQIKLLKRNQAQSEKDYIKASRESIVKRLIARGLQRTISFPKKAVSEYLEDFVSDPPELSGEVNLNTKAAPGQQLVKFYFLGDIIHTIMDCLFLPSGPVPERFSLKKDIEKEFIKRRKETEKFVLLLSSFIYSDYNSKDPIFSANIADMPISVKYFNEWMINNVVKSEKQVYPLIDFIRDLLRALVDLITDACINRQLDVSLMFQTTQITALGKVLGGKKKIYKDSLLYAKKVNFITDTDKEPSQGSLINVDKLYNKGKKPYFPLKTADPDDPEIPLKNYFDYTLLYPVSPVLSTSHTGRGKRIDDEKTGTYHFQIGSDRGLLKNIKFAKTDMAYLREARFYNQGNYGLLQLGAVYNVELELFGNTLFYPGMEIFIDPRGFGGSDWDPTAGGKSRSVANALGIGGYHIITKVNSTISPSGFKTNVSAVFQYSGDGDSRTMALDGQTVTTTPSEVSESDDSNKSSFKCVQIVENALQRSIKAQQLTKGQKKNKKTPP